MSKLLLLTVLNLSYSSISIASTIIESSGDKAEEQTDVYTPKLQEPIIDEETNRYLKTNYERLLVESGLNPNGSTRDHRKK